MRIAPEELSERIKVLIVDDDHWVTRGLAAVLAVLPEVRVLGAAYSGEEAVATFRAEPADVVLMDINLGPGLTGIEATQAILALKPDARVLALTTTTPGPGLLRALQAGAVAALKKTVSSTTLASTVIKAARGEDPTLIKGLLSDVLISDDMPKWNERWVAPELTSAELRILRLICAGKSYREIAGQLTISTHTVESHAKRLRQKLHARGLGELVVKALEYRFVSP